MQSNSAERGVTLRAGDAITVRGRTFSPEDLERIREVVVGSPADHRNALSKKVCEVLGWYQENGRLKDRSCRDVLRRLDDLGIIQLPPPLHPPRPRRGSIPLTSRTDPRLCFPLAPRDVQLEHFSIVSKAKNQEALWNEFIERYHYLGFGVVVGPQIKYFVHVRGEPVACLSFGGAAWKVESRDRWIGWTEEERKKNLRYVVNNTRYLLFPWVTVKNLASRVLSLAVRRLPEDWERRYGYRPCLLETFIHSKRHAGTCYRAANWVFVGETKGRGRMDRYKESKLPKKGVLLYPLVDDVPAALTCSARPVAGP